MIWSINFKSKQMFEKDKLFSWVEPKRTQSPKIHCDLRVNFKYGAFRLSREFANQYRMNGAPKLSFILKEDEKAFAVPNPKEGVPFYLFRDEAQNPGGSLICSNSDLARKIKQRFVVPKNGIEVKSMDFKLDFYEKISGMSFYSIVPGIS